MAPEYLCELVSIRKSSGKLRSLLIGDCAFSVAAPTLWISLPADIRNASSLGKCLIHSKTAPVQGYFNR